ncbi:unnamed protein product [Notodromas monacha]|uniref:Uncharacterized protein n=1 Tax=Notodromas monacha TaxID=399045 RepID=A0A7R9GDM7_9CRUS|nr:unnamed protein product [Notodromas monacha]CAG0918699.1 unnamed protein product [Notodromas monacha]
MSIRILTVSSCFFLILSIFHLDYGRIPEKLAAWTNMISMKARPSQTFFIKSMKSNGQRQDWGKNWESTWDLLPYSNGIKVLIDPMWTQEENDAWDLPVNISTDGDYEGIFSHLPSSQETMENPLLIRNLNNSVLLPPAWERDYALTNADLQDPSELQMTRKIIMPLLQERFMQNVSNGGIFFEVGALDGEKSSRTLYLERFHNWTGILAEMTGPNLNLLRSKNRKAWIAPVCVSNEKRPLVVMTEEGNSDERLMLDVHPGFSANEDLVSFEDAAIEEDGREMMFGGVDSGHLQPDPTSHESLIDMISEPARVVLDVPVEAAEVASSMQFLSGGEWRKVEELLQVARLDVLYDDACSGLTARVEKKRSENAVLEEKLAILELDEIRLVERTSCLVSAAERANESVLRARHNLDVTFACEAKVDRAALLSVCNQKGHQYVVLKDCENIVEEDGVVSVPMEGSVFHFGHQDALHRFWECRLAPVGAVPDVDISGKRVRDDCDDENGVRGGAKVLRSNGPVVVPQGGLSQKEVHFAPSFASVVKSGRESPFSVTCYRPRDLSSYVKAVSLRMGLTSRVLAALNGHKVDLPIPGCLVEDFHYGAPKLRHDGPALMPDKAVARGLLLSDSLCSLFRLVSGRWIFLGRMGSIHEVMDPILDFEYLMRDIPMQLFQV